MVKYLATTILLATAFQASAQFNRSLRPLSAHDTLRYGAAVQESARKMKMAEFKGGLQALVKFISKHVEMPKDARKEKVNGQVVVRFVIDSLGHVKKESVTVVQSLTPSCDSEAIRVIRKSPTWIPGRNLETNKNVDCWFQIPVRFRAKD